MKFSSAAFTVAAVSLLSSTHAAPLSFQDGEISGRLHHRRGSDLADVSTLTAPSRASDALEELDIGFEPGSHLILPRILNFIKRQVSSPVVGVSDASGEPTAQSETGSTSGTTGTAGTSGAEIHTSLMQPDMEEYGFASESGPGLHLVQVKEVKV